MGPEIKRESLLKEAREHEKRYNWLKAAKAYQRILDSKPRAPKSVAETWEKIGDCYKKASRQARKLEEFKTIRQYSVEAYEKAATLFENELKTPGKAAQCKALAKSANSWIAKDFEEKEKIVSECEELGKKALETFRLTGDSKNYGKTCNNLLLCLYERLYMTSDEEQKKSIANEGLLLSRKAIAFLSKHGEKQELIVAHSLASLLNWYSANISRLEIERKPLALNSLEHSEKAVLLSKEIDDPYSNAMSRWAASYASLYFGEIDSALTHAEEMLEHGSIASDNYLKGIASFMFAHIFDWMVAKEENPEKRREEYNEIIKFSKDAVTYLQRVAQDFHIASTFLFFAESYSALGRELEFEVHNKRILLEKAVDVGRIGLDHAFKSGYIDAISPVYHALSKALHSYSNLLQETDEKTRLLEEALVYREEYIKVVQKAFPSNTWVLGVGKNYAGLIEAELSKLETDKERKSVLLSAAISDMKDGILYTRRWISSHPVQSTISVVASFEDTYGGILEKQYRYTEEEDNLADAIDVYNDAAERFSRIGLHSRAAESYWKIALNEDTLGEHQTATKSFEKAWAEYKAASRKLPQFADFYLDYAIYMKAWSEIEIAKAAHLDREYTVATKQYETTATLLNKTKNWNYLSVNFFAWSVLERAEDLSRKEELKESLKSFEEAYDLFNKSHRLLQVNLERIERDEEKELAKRLIEASKVRAKYCLGRISIEDAKSLDRKGKHISSSRKYGSAAKIFKQIIQDSSKETQNELKPLVILCQAWQKMMIADARASPILYEEAAELFKEVKEHAPDQQTSMLALANSSFCKALQSGTEFEITRDLFLYSTAKKHMTTASNYYLKAGLKNASEFAKATQCLFDAYVFIDNAKKESDPTKEEKYYLMAERVLQTSALSFKKARHFEKHDQVQRLLENLREEKALALSLGEVIRAPTVASSAASFPALSATEETAVGLERFEHAEVQTKLVLHDKEIRVGDKFNLNLQIANMGKHAVSLAKISQLIPSSFQLVAKPDYAELVDEDLEMKGKRLDPLKSEEIELALRPLETGTFKIKPVVVCVDETGNQLIGKTDPLDIQVEEVILPDRLSTGKKELDTILMGGIPEKYAVALTGSSSDERDLLIKSFLETGVKHGQTTFHITVEASGVRTLAEDFQSHFFLFMCNPRADSLVPTLPNVYKIRGATHITNLNIALTRAFRTIDKSSKVPRRACIEIVSDVLLRHQAVATRRWLSELIPDLRSKGFTTLAVIDPLMHPPDQFHSVLSLFEGEISIFDFETKTGTEKFLRIKHLRNKKYNDKPIHLERKQV